MTVFNVQYKELEAHDVEAKDESEAIEIYLFFNVDITKEVLMKDIKCNKV